MGCCQTFKIFFNEEDFNTKMFVTLTSYTLLIWKSLDL